MKFDLREAPAPYGWGYNTSRFVPKDLEKLIQKYKKFKA